jgi:hypothetical protein
MRIELALMPAPDNAAATALAIAPPFAKPHRAR